MLKQSPLYRTLTVVILALALSLTVAIPFWQLDVPPSQAAPPVKPALLTPGQQFEFDTWLNIIVAVPPNPPIPLMAQGPTKIEVKSIQQDTPGLGQNTIDVEIVELSLMGVTPVNLGSQPFSVRLDPNAPGPSAGQIIGPANGPDDVNFPANSFFDVFVQIDIPGIGQIDNQQDSGGPTPIQVVNQILHIPPLGPLAFADGIPGYHTIPNNPAQIQLYDANTDNPVGVIENSLPTQPGVVHLPHEPITRTKVWLDPDPNMFGFVGNPVNYQIGITNTGVTTLTRITVVDVLSNSGQILAFDQASTAPDSVVSDTDTITITWNDLLPASTVLTPGNSIFLTTTYQALAVGHPQNRVLIETEDELAQVFLPTLLPPLTVTAWITEGFDFGDAPDDSGNALDYPTLLASDGARHRIVPGFSLGAKIDAETDGQPNSDASGDDLLDGNDDEDGVAFNTAVEPGSTVSLTVTASAAGVLDAWIDLNLDHDWADGGEQIFDDEPLVVGANLLTFTVPTTATTTPTTTARFRFSSAGVLSYTGLASDGEVEDYVITESSSLVYLPIILK